VAQPQYTVLVLSVTVPTLSKWMMAQPPSGWTLLLVDHAHMEELADVQLNLRVQPSPAAKDKVEPKAAGTAVPAATTPRPVAGQAVQW